MIWYQGLLLTNCSKERSAVGALEFTEQIAQNKIDYPHSFLAIKRIVWGALQIRILSKNFQHHEVNFVNLEHVDNQYFH